MPQFDFTTFTEQIFWLLICFGILYFAVSRIIIPRIAAILEVRENKISSDQGSASVLQEKIAKVEEDSKKLREKSSKNYFKSIENTLEKCTLDREKAFNKVAVEIEEMTSKSEKKISDTIKKSKSDYSKVATTLADTIVKKIFSKDLKFNKEIKVPVSEK